MDPYSELEVDQFYQDRLQTFALIQNDEVSAVLLASAGFHYDRETKHILCSKCDLTLAAEYKVSFDPLSYHIALTDGLCPYVMERSKKQSKKAKINQQSGSTAPTTSNEAAANKDGVIKLQERIQLLQLQGNEGTSTSNQSNPLDVMTRYSTTLNSAVRECGEKLPDMRRFHQKIMEDEVARAATFRDIQSTNPDIASVLAYQGLSVKATETGNILCCTFCPFQHDNFDSTALETYTLHLRHPSRCPHIRGVKTPQHIRNIPDIYSADFLGSDEQPSSYRGLGIHEDPAECPELAVYQRREDTFLTCPHPSSYCEKLAEAGYYYKGGESVTCFWCGCTSAHWTVEEDPWIRHARTSPTCRFLILQKGQDFVDAVFELHGRYTPPELSRKQQTERNIERKMIPRMQANCVQQAIRMGTGGAMVRTVVENRIREKKPDFNCSADIVREVQELAHKLQSQEPPQLVLPKPINCPQLPNNEAEVPEPTEGDETREVSDTLPEDAQDVIELGRQLKMQLTCKVCLSDVAGIGYIPCGHLVCCVSCSASLSICPICRKDIKGTVRVNLPNY